MPLYKIESARAFIERKNLEFKKMKPIIMKDISRNGHHTFYRRYWTFMQQSNLAQKVFIIERLERKEILGETGYGKKLAVGDIEYRIGYYIVGKIGTKKTNGLGGNFVQ